MEFIVLLTLVLFFVKSVKGQAIVSETSETLVVLSRTARKGAEALEKQVDELLSDEEMETKANAAKAKLAKAAKKTAKAESNNDYDNYA